MADNHPGTVGIEIEGTTLTRDLVADLIKSDPEYGHSSVLISSITRDASVEGSSLILHKNMKLFLGDSHLRQSFNRSQIDRDVVGYEIVSKPMTRLQARSVVANTMNTLNRNGEIFSPRSSVHIHVGFPKSLIFYKTAIALGLKIEPLLYKIAGLGREYRGKINESAYARPLCSPPAIAIPFYDNERCFAALDPRGAIGALGETEFWRKFGITRQESNRYTPLRYFGINIFSILLRGTLEFRVFNFTEKPVYIIGVSELCQLIADLMIRLPLSTIDGVSDMSIFEKNTDSDYIGALHNLVRLGEYYNSPLQIEKETIDTIEEIICKTPQPEFNRRPVKTHLKSYMLSPAYMDSLLKVDDPVDPGIIDIHNFHTQNYSMIGEI